MIREIFGHDRLVEIRVFASPTGLHVDILRFSFLTSGPIGAMQFASFDGNLCQICWFVVCNGYVQVLMRGCYHFPVSFFLVSCI